MAFVKQRTKTDCGVAALAMLCDVTYEQARAVVVWHSFKLDPNLRGGTTTRTLRKAAISLGYKTKSTPQNRLKTIKTPDVVRVGKLKITGWETETWNSIPDNSLVKIPFTPGRRGWHWVVWKNRKIYDPARGVFLPRKFDRVPTSYMEFVQCAK